MNLTPSPRALWTAGWSLFAFLVVASFTTSGIATDGLLNLYLGRHVVEHGIPHADTLTIAGAGRPWVDQQWLAQAAFYGAWSVGGYPAVAVLSAGASAAGYGLLARLMLRDGRTGSVVWPWMLAVLLATFMNTFVRAQSLAFPLFVLILGLVLDDAGTDQPRWRRWLVILLLLVVWANLHGSVLLATLLVSLYGLARAGAAARARRWRACGWYALFAGAALSSTLATPYGIGVIPYFADVLGNDVIASSISEWRPARVGSLESTPYLLLLVGTVAIVAFGYGKGVRPPVVLGLSALVLGALGATALRYHVWGAIPVGLLGCVMTARLRARPATRSGSREHRLLLVATAALALGAALIPLGYRKLAVNDWLYASPVPQVHEAARLMAADPDLTLLADLESAPAALWLHPAEVSGRIGFDARLEHFQQADLERYFHFALADHPNWLAAAEGYDLLLFSRTEDRRAADLIELERGWRVVSRSRDGVLVQRTGP